MTEKSSSALVEVVEVFEIIKSRRTIHSYSDKKVSDEILQSALESAIHAPNHHLTWPWFFIRVQGKTRNEIADLYVKLKSQKSPLSVKAAEAARVKILEAPVLLIAGIKKRVATEREDYASLACALQNMALYLWSENVGMKWSTGQLIQASELYSLLNISSDTHEIAGVIHIGYPRVIPQKTERPPLEQFYRSV